MKNKDLNSVWKKIQGDLQVQLDAGQYMMFVAQSDLMDYENKDGKVKLCLGVASEWHIGMIKRRWGRQIEEAGERVFGGKCELEFKVREIKPTKEKELGPLFAKQTTSDKQQTICEYEEAVRRLRLRPELTFENFAVSSSNEMAHAAAMAVAENPGEAYQLLFLYGGVGVGKTHLMQSVAHKLLQKNPDEKICLVPAEEFMNELIDSIRKKRTMNFKNKYRTVKALLIDDVQFIGGKNTVQEEFFHTFNAIQKEGGQIILTSDLLPGDIQGLEDRLRSRFEGGLTVDIQEPSFELRTAILLIKAKALELELPMDVARLVAGKITETRRLEGVLRSILAWTHLRKKMINPEAVKEILGEEFVQEEIKPMSKVVRPGEIIEAVARFYELKPRQITGKKRQKNIVRGRHMVMFLLREDLKINLEDVGNMLGGRDHTTIMHAVEKIDEACKTDEKIRGELELLRKQIYG